MNVELKLRQARKEALLRDAAADRQDMAETSRRLGQGLGLALRSLLLGLTMARLWTSLRPGRRG